MNINKSALKLSMLYLGILSTICFIFSAAFYNVSLQEVERALVRDPGHGPRLQVNREVEAIDMAIRRDVVNDLRASLIIRLVVVNLALLSVGGVLSYIFALQTLRPIEESKKKLEQFTADAAHDLRTPLSAMKIENEIFLDNPDNKLADAKDQIQSNLEEVNRLIGLAQSLLTLSSSKENTSQSDVNLNEVIQSVIKTAEPISVKKSINIIQDVGDLGVIKGDQSLLERAIMAVVDNAIKYSDKKSDITITGLTEKDSRVIKVVDSGMGISAKDINHIFDRFYRTDSSRKRVDAGGHGLGLAIAKEIIEDHGGSITVVSKKSKGSTFSIIL